MQQRDYLMRQIEQMSKVLVALIRKLLGLKSVDLEEETIHSTNEVLQEQLNTSIDEILATPLKEVAEFITQLNGLDISNLELFADILVLNAKVYSDKTHQKKLFETGLELYNWADEKSSTFSMERQMKIRDVKNSLIQ